MVRMDLSRSGPCLPVGATCSQRFAYDWDEVGRLSRARRWDTAPGASIDDPLPGGTPAADLRYKYDAGDQRVIKHAVDTSGESFTLYVFASLELRRSQFGTDYSDTGSGPADYEASVFTVVPYLLANGVRLARLAYEGTSEVPEVATGTGAGQVNASVSQVHVFFELGDHLGSTSVVLDKATSELVERSTFQGYGATESDYRPGRWNAFREDYRFTGKEEDAEVGLTYFGKRYLNAYLGRWISADPLAIHAPGEADLNVYAYVSGSILKNVDPLGLEEQTVDAANAGGASAADPAEHMGTGHEGASSDGSYLEATSDPEWQKGAGGALAGVALTGCAIASAGACAAGLVQFELTRQAIADTPASPGSQEAQNREIASDSNGAMLVAGATAKAAAPVAVAAGRAALAGARSVVAPWLREWAKKSGLFEKTSSIRTAASEAGEIGGSKPETGLIADVTVESRGEVLGRGTVDVRGTLERIKSGDLQPRDTFRNREGLLPSQPDGYYKEFYHPTPGYKGTGPERVIRGDGGEFFYTPNHYKSFIPLN